MGDLDGPATPDAASETRRLASGVALVFGGVMHVVVGWFYLVSSLIAPPWAVVVLWLVWLALAWAGWWQRRRPLLVLSIPFIAAAVWFGAITAGGELLGWSA